MMKMMKKIIQIETSTKKKPTKGRHDYKGNFRHEIMEKQIHEK